MLSPHDRRSDGVLLGLVLKAKPNRHGEVVAAALRHKRSMQLDRHLSSKLVPVAALADVEVLGQQAEVAGEGQAVAAAHELHAGDQVAGGFAALGLGVGALGLGIGKSKLQEVGAFLNHESAVELLGRQPRGLTRLNGLGLSDGTLVGRHGQGLAVLGSRGAKSGKLAVLNKLEARRGLHGPTRGLL